MADDFRVVTDEEGLTVHVTPVGELATIAVMNKDLYQIVVRSSKDVAFDYIVHGVRRAFKAFEPVATGSEFMPGSASERMPLYLTEEAKSRLLSNGTYNADGTVNADTAEKAGWTKIWADQEAAAKNEKRPQEPSPSLRCRFAAAPPREPPPSHVASAALPLRCGSAA